MKLYLNTVSSLLWETLVKLMTLDELNEFRIVGGTSLSLQLGHRESVDIDMFTDSAYGNVDFSKLETVLRATFPCVQKAFEGPVGMGTSFFIGGDENDLVKLDLFYTDPFVFPCIIEQGIRFSSKEEVAAMKFEVIGQGGRKKDFWDIHELLETFTLEDLIAFYLKRNPYGFSKDKLLKQVLDFSFADEDLTPNCFKGKEWELIKIDLEELVRELNL